jgi:hypothetical protein
VTIAVATTAGRDRVAHGDPPGRDHLAPHAEGERLTRRDVGAVRGDRPQRVEVADASVRVERGDGAAADRLADRDRRGPDPDATADPAVLRVGVHAVDADRHAEAAAVHRPWLAGGIPQRVE